MFVATEDSSRLAVGVRTYEGLRDQAQRVLADRAYSMVLGFCCRLKRRLL